MPTSPALATRAVETEDDVLPRYRRTPIGELLLAHNLDRQLKSPSAAPGAPPMPALLIVACMDHRLVLDLPPGFAFQVRTAGATPLPLLSNVAFAVSVTGLQAMCVIGHTDCAMCRVGEVGEAMTDHLVEREGWERSDAHDQLDVLHQVFRIDDPVTATWEHARMLAGHFPSCVVAPLLYRVEDHSLAQIERAPAV